MAIDELLDEHEQGERVRNWLRRNGAALIAGVGLGLLAVWGWYRWQDSQAAAGIAQAARFEAALDAIGANAKDAAAKAKGLDGAYGLLAGLELAKAQVSAGERDAAIATLRGLRAEDPALKRVVDIRLGRLLIDAGKYDDAARVLAAHDTAAALEARGDAAFAQKQLDQARTHYQQALSKTDVAAPLRSVLELKLIQAGGTPAKPESQS